MKFRILLAAAMVIAGGCAKDDTDPLNPADAPYALVINAASFLPGDSMTGNTYFPLAAGRVMIFEGYSEGDSLRVEVTITDTIKIIQGVACRVVRDRGFTNGELTEDTHDWYAQDRSGNVWYFGEKAFQLENGQIIGTTGSWETAVNGALPGVVMPAAPLIGMWYRQEYFKGEAEDVAQVLSVGESLTVPTGTYNNCLRTLEYSPLESGVEEQKIYAPGLGLLKTIDTKGSSGFETLVSVTGP
jgi:hypothetical protein